MSRNDGERRGVHFVAAVTYIDEGKVQQALAELGVEYELAQKMDDAPNAAGDQINMGNIHLEQGDAATASEHYKKALALAEDAELPSCRFCFGRRVGRVDASIG